MNNMNHIKIARYFSLLFVLALLLVTLIGWSLESNAAGIFGGSSRGLFRNRGCASCSNGSCSSSTNNITEEVDIIVVEQDKQNKECCDCKCGCPNCACSKECCKDNDGCCKCTCGCDLCKCCNRNSSCGRNCNSTCNDCTSSIQNYSQRSVSRYKSSSRLGLKSGLGKGRLRNVIKKIFHR